MNFGRITTESSEEYHAQDCVSASKLRVFARRPGGPQLYHQSFIAKTLQREDSEALIFGRAFHTAILEPAKFESEFIVAPEGIDRRTTIGKAAWAAFEVQAGAKTILKADTMKLLETMTAQVGGHPNAMKLLWKGEPEVSWRVQAGGFKHLPPLQCRTDWFCAEGCELSEGRPYIMDVKTTGTLEEEAFGNFQRGFEEHAYHVQAGLYMAILGALGINVFDFFFIACEKVAPFGVKVYKLASRELDEGQNIATDLLVALDQCYARNQWPNTPLEVEELKLSPGYWARKDRRMIAA